MDEAYRAYDRYLSSHSAGVGIAIVYAILYQDALGIGFVLTIKLGSSQALGL